MSRKRFVTSHEILANQQPGRRAIAHRLTKASSAVWANNPSEAVDMLKQADGALRTLEMTWPEVLGVAVYSPPAATTTATATAE